MHHLARRRAITDCLQILLTETCGLCCLSSQAKPHLCRFANGASTSWSKFLPFPPLPFPPLPSLSLLSLPLPLEVGPLIAARGPGERFSSPSGSGQSPAAKRYLVNFRLKISPLVATIFRSFSGNETSN